MLPGGRKCLPPSFHIHHSSQLLRVTLFLRSLNGWSEGLCVEVTMRKVFYYYEGSSFELSHLLSWWSCTTCAAAVLVILPCLCSAESVCIIWRTQAHVCKNSKWRSIVLRLTEFMAGLEKEVPSVFYICLFWRCRGIEFFLKWLLWIYRNCHQSLLLSLYVECKNLLIYILY